MSDEPEKPAWRPLDVRQGGAPAEAEYDALHEGVPPWLTVSLLKWVHKRLHASHTDVYGSAYSDWSEPALLRLQRELRFTLDWSDGKRTAAESLLHLLQSDSNVFLKTVDYLLRDVKANSHYEQSALIDLIVMLRQAGSAWKVAPSAATEDGLELQRRVLDTADSSARAALEAGRPGDHLRIAWSAAYGVSPNPNVAYDEAVRAVEAAAQPVVCPKDPKASLGVMIVALRDKPTKWELVIYGPTGFDQIESVRLMAELLWKGHRTRHGTSDPNAPMVQQQDQAEAAVHLAVLLVHWFATGAIRRVP